jgi:hypothetical protein
MRFVVASCCTHTGFCRRLPGCLSTLKDKMTARRHALARNAPVECVAQLITINVATLFDDHSMRHPKKKKEKVP